MSSNENIAALHDQSLIDSLVSRVRLRIQEKNLANGSAYSKQIINDIIYNEKAHIVAIFKDFLIYDDTSEFLKRSYKTHETKSRLLKIYEFYDSYSKIFPNYTVLTEAKYIYKNIQRKQKMIDNLQKKNKLKQEQQEKSNEDKIFHTDVYNSIMNLTVSTMRHEEPQLPINHPANLPLKDKITRKELNLSIKIEETDESLEGLIQNIGKAEETISLTPIKYSQNVKKPPETTKESRLKIQSLIKSSGGVGHSQKTNFVNLNQFNKKVELNTKQYNRRKLDYSPNINLKKNKETIVLKNPSPHERTIFKSIQFNDKLNINNLLESVSGQASNLVPKRESFHTKSSNAEDRRVPDSDRMTKNEVSTKVTLQIPKNASGNHIYNNFNIINNFSSGEPNNPSSAVPISQINIISDLSPKTNSARIISKIEIKKEESSKDLKEALKPKTLLKPSNSHSVNIGPKQIKKDDNHLRLRKNNTNVNVLSQDDKKTNLVVLNELKAMQKTNSSNAAASTLNSILKLNTIKSPSYANEGNSISLTKRDRAISLTARQFIRQDSMKNKAAPGRTTEDVSSSQNFNSPGPSIHKKVSLVNTTRLIKSSVSNAQLIKQKFKASSTLDKPQEFSSPKFIKRNNSETYKLGAKNKQSDFSQLQLEISKSPNTNPINQKMKASKNYSIEQKNETSTSSRLRIASAKNSTLSPAKNTSLIMTKSSNFKPSNDLLHSDVKIKKFDDGRSLSSKIQTICASSENSGGSLRMKKKIEEKFKESKNMVKII